MKPVTRIHSRSVVLADANIDTDRIIPARFLTTTQRQGLGRHCFADWRYRKDGSDNPDFPLNAAAARDCSILVAGRNFGCGSSREHAPWALLDYGIRAVISSEIADIFRNNALKNGLLALVVDTDAHRRLLESPGMKLDIHVAAGVIEPESGAPIHFDLEPFARHCLLEGTDPMGYLMGQLDAIDRFEQAREVAA